MNTNLQGNFSLTQTVLNKLAEVYLSSQMKECENMTIDIDSEAEKLVKGEVNSVGLQGKNLIIFNDLSFQKINLILDNIALDLVEIIAGKIKLVKPAKLNAKITLGTADCECLLNSKYLNTILQKLQVEIGDRLFTLEIRRARCDLKNNNKLTLCAEIVLSSNAETKTAEFIIDLVVEKGGEIIVFEGGRYRENQALSLDATIAIFRQIRELLYFRHYNSPNLNLTIDTVEIKAKQLIVSVNAMVNKLPESLEKPLKITASEIN